LPTLYRVFPFVPKSAPRQPGGPLFIPGQGGGRLDNPDLYSVFYMSSSPPAAIAEAFGRFPEWSKALLEGSPSLPGSFRAIARYQLSARVSVCNLDDPAQLVRLNLRPSEVVIRDYTRTRAWARRIYEQRKWAGLQWWSYYNSEWTSVGLWDISRLSVSDVEILRVDHEPFIEASRTIVRRIVETSTKRTSAAHV
jgi:hypothetical protein